MRGLDLHPIAVLLMAIWVVIVVAFALQLKSSKASRPANVAVVDSFYAVMVGRDSLTVLEGVKAVSVQLDSLCIVLSGEEC